MAREAKVNQKLTSVAWFELTLKNLIHNKINYKTFLLYFIEKKF